ncbi:M48 family metallopeptidase [Undibacterium sp.]|uniref:M48 family metallopeptidase n=1 Tax=Undibacterium sp. TaxID=1914977 RepID=UPI002D134A92|nr:M48 family metallopeptidase [Undibacterium sp.]HTD07141.1 M48 family metallopeptidase [Undibacterium sp.]
MPPRMERPDVATDEGGLWALMDREEAKLRRSPFAIRDAELRSYVQEIICRLAGDHCPDVRVYLVRNRYFNANMAPNGMMQVWSGLMLRVDNEAQLAAVLGHEIGHYLQRHSIDTFRDARSRSAFGVFLGMFGVIGLVGQLASVAGAFANSRGNELQADRIGLSLMSKAGYDPAEAAKVWENLLLEAKANPAGDPTKNSPMFATHPPMADRKDTLAQLAAALPRGVTNEKTWQEKTAPYRREWLNEEVKRGQFEESIALLSRLMQRSPEQPDFVCARADVYRMRSSDTDLNAALADYQAAIALGGEPPEAHRGMGMIYRQRDQPAETKKSFTRYLQLAPEAPDSAMIKNYLEELGA